MHGLVDSPTKLSIITMYIQTWSKEDLFPIPKTFGNGDCSISQVLFYYCGAKELGISLMSCTAFSKNIRFYFLCNATLHVSKINLLHL